MLSSIGIIKELIKHPNADKIVEAVVVCGLNGKYSGVVGINSKIGDKVIVFFQDAILKPNAHWQYLEKENWRIKTRRFRGIPSECLIVPVFEPYSNLSVGTIIDEQLELIKYVKDNSLISSQAGEIIGDFPATISKTDEPNYQVCERDYGHSWQELLKQEWVCTLKYDGSSCTVWKENNIIRVASRNYEIADSDNIYWNIVKELKLIDLMENFTAIQGEVIGQKIQGNPCGLTARDLKIFNFLKYSKEEQRYVKVNDYKGELEKFKVSQLYSSKDNLKIDTEEELRALANVKYPLNKKPAEGIVFQGLSHNWSFKVINLNYE